MPDHLLACPVCIAEQNDHAMHGLQLEYLRRVVAGDWNYTLRVVRTAEKHVLLFASHRTFCGKEIPGKPRIEHTHYTEDALTKLCPDCRAAIAVAVEEALAL